MQYTLRPYQKAAVEKLLWSQKFPEPDICVLPTGAGKSLVIADLAHKLNQPVLVLQPSREILLQNQAKMETYVNPSEVGVYSAGVGRKDISTFTFATIQSVYKKPEEFAHFKQVIIDECHSVNPKNLDGMFTAFLSRIGNPKVVGFTATPYRQEQFYERTSEGELYTHTTTKLINRIAPRFWHRIVFNINNHELVKAGFLVPLRYFDKSVISHSDIPTNISKSDFNLNAFEDKISKKETEILETIFLAEQVSKSVLVFCSSIQQAQHYAEIVDNSAVVTAKTPPKLRAKIVDDFKTGKIKTVFNVGIFTVGFDHPGLDAIVLLRPTRSIALYYQMLGRGVRKVEGKTHCKVFDLTGTVKEIGRIESIQLIRQGQWELISETGSWHKKPLYSFMVGQTTTTYTGNPFLD